MKRRQSASRGGFGRRVKTSVQGQEISMRHLTRSVTLAAVSLAALIAAQGGAQAGAFALREQSATASGYVLRRRRVRFGRPVVDVLEPGDHHHGARVPGEFHATASSRNRRSPPPTRSHPDSPASGLRAISASMRSCPTSYATYQVNDRLWFGLYSGAPFGLATKPQRDLGRPALLAHDLDLLVRGDADRRLQGQ